VTPDRTGILASSVRPTGQKLTPPASQFPVRVALSQPAKAGDSVKVRLSVSAFVCDEGSSVCRVKNYGWNVPVTFVDGGSTEVKLAAPTAR
jgi:hypothetical protein